MMNSDITTWALPEGALTRFGSRFPLCGGLSPAMPTSERWRGTGPRPTLWGTLFYYRSAGACPPRSF